eukprot:7717944-Alexandrium_andersonii.AAC.1
MLPAATFHPHSGPSEPHASSAVPALVGLPGGGQSPPSVRGPSLQSDMVFLLRVCLLALGVAG